MFLIAGLGNPGKKYKNTRHNIGFEILDKFQKENNFPKFKLSKKFNYLVSKEKISNKEIILTKPQSFMNKSGQAVKAILNFQFLNNLIVVHDDIDLPLGKIRISKASGSAGHKGVESIIKELKTKNFIRLRIGIQPQKGKPKNPETFVLDKFGKNEEKILKKVIKIGSQALKTICAQDPEKAMNQFNQ